MKESGINDLYKDAVNFNSIFLFCITADWAYSYQRNTVRKSLVNVKKQVRGIFPPYFIFKNSIYERQLILFKEDRDMQDLNMGVLDTRMKEVNDMERVYFGSSSLNDICRAQVVSLTKSVILGNNLETDTISCKDLVSEILEVNRKKGIVCAWMCYDHDKRLKNAYVFCDASQKCKIKERIKESGQLVFKTIAKNPELSKEILGLVPDIDICYDKILAERIKCLAQKQVEQELNEVEDKYREKCRKYCFEEAVKNYWEDEEMEERTKVEATNTNTKEEQTMKKQKKSEKTVMEPMMKHIERMEQEASQKVEAVTEKDVEDVKVESIGLHWDFDEIEIGDDTIEESEIIQLLKEIERDESEIRQKQAFAMDCEKHGLDRCEKIVGTSNDGRYDIIMRAIGNGKKRYYNIYERERETKILIGYCEDENTFSVRQIKREPVMISDCIDNFYGDYRKKENIIKMNIQKVESSRLLDLCLEGYISSFEDIIEEFKSFIILNPTMVGLLHINIDGETEVGIIGDKETFEKIVDKALPGYKFTRFRTELKMRNLLKVTGNEPYRYTRNIERGKARELGWTTDKFYNFNFGKEFVMEYQMAFEEVMKKKGGNGNEQ